MLKDWKVVNALSRDVEREHLNKILKEVKSTYQSLSDRVGTNENEVRDAQQSLNSTIVRVVTETIPSSALVTRVELTGDVTGTSTVIAGQNAVTVNTTLSEAVLQDAPVDSFAYWRRTGNWEPVQPPVDFLNEIAGQGFTVWDELNQAWYTRYIMSADDTRIVVTEGGGLADDVYIDLAEVTPEETGTLQLTRFDAYGRRDGEAAATTDDLPEGTSNLYWKEAPEDGAIYGRRNGAWVEVTGGTGSAVLPVVTGEIVNGQPVFVYNDDGSLVYTEI